MLGGRAADMIVFGELTTGAANDIEQATNLARKMVCEWGMSEKLGPLTFGKKDEMVFLGRELGAPEELQRADRRADRPRGARAGRGRARARAAAARGEPRQARARSRSTLLEREQLDGEALAKVMRGETLPPHESPNRNGDGAAIAAGPEPAPEHADVRLRRARTHHHRAHARGLIAVATAPHPVAATWRVRGREFDLARRALVMGVLNVTPDSFSDGGRYADPGAALERALAMIEEGADLIDVGGESTRPGSAIVPADEEIARVRPVLERLVPRTPVPVSIDTRKTEVARVALELGAAILNDVSGLRVDPAGGGGHERARLAAGHGAGLVLMHMQGTPADDAGRPALRRRRWAR